MPLADYELPRRAKVDHVEIDPVAFEVIQEVARRILADETGKITVATEAVRLNREGIPSPADRLAQLYGRPLKGAATSSFLGRGECGDQVAHRAAHSRGHPHSYQDGAS